MPTDDSYFRVAGPSTSVIDLHPSVFDLPQLTKPSASSMPSESTVFKKRKLDRACDFCRRRKTKCDGPSKPDNVCSNCTQNHNRCTYLEASRPRGPPKAYVTSLEDRLERMEAWLKRLRPEEDFSDRLGPPVFRDSWKYDSPSTASKHKGDPAESPSRGERALPQLNLDQTTKLCRGRDRSSVARDEDSQYSNYFASSDDEDYAGTSLLPGHKRLTFHGLEPVVNPGVQSREKDRDNQMRFHGKSSSLCLIGPTREFKKQYFMAVEESTGLKVPAMEAPPLRRPLFWKSPQWETAWEGIHLNDPSLFHSLTESFPPPDLAAKLVDLYFYNVNLMLPILHRPTFDQQWAEGLQRHDAYFAAMCMGVFCVASRWCNDPRVLDTHTSPDDLRDTHLRSEIPPCGQAGWTYCIPILEFLRRRKSVLHPACLFEMQLYCLLATYFRLQPCTSWNFIAVGLRNAHDVGIHRKKIYSKSPTVEDELWKRSFWVLSGLHRIAAADLGRSCASREEDIDVEMPIEVDDEYWISDIPGMAFKQPSGKPSTVAAFNLWIKLAQISAFAIRTIYAVDKSKVAPLGLGGPQWGQQVVRQLNTAMSEWVDSVPEHLKWSARMDNPVFANQSATLFLTYYTTQILIYRPFIPPSYLDSRSRKSSTAYVNFPFPALSICINAAKACLGILEVQLETGMTDIPTAILASQSSAAILVIHIWRLKAQERHCRLEALHETKPAPGQTIPELIRDVNKFIEILGNVSAQYPLARYAQDHLVQSLPTDLSNGNHETSFPDLTRIRIQPVVDYLMPCQPDPVLPLFATSPMDFSAEQLDPHARSRRYTPHPPTSFLPADNATIARPGSTSSSTSWPSEGRGNEYSFESNSPPSWMSYYAVSSDISRQENPCNARSVVCIGQPKKRPASVHWSHSERHEQIVKREAFDDYNIIQKFPGLRQSILGPSHMEMFPQSPDVGNDWYMKNPRHQDWSIQSNVRATYAALE